MYLTSVRTTAVLIPSRLSEWACSWVCPRGDHGYHMLSIYSRYVSGRGVGEIYIKFTAPCIHTGDSNKVTT